MRNRREQVDLEEGAKTDMYGKKLKGFEAEDENDIFTCTQAASK